MANRKLNRIKVVLVEQGVTSAELAKALGKNPVSVSRWCTNETQPSLETLFDVADYLKVDIAELLNRTL